MANDPFATTNDAPKPIVQETPKADNNGNYVSFVFNSATGYDRINARVGGDPHFVAEAMGIKEFDGRISTLMKQAVVVDGYFKKWYAGDDSGKA